MESQKAKRGVIVGIFILLALALFITGVLALGGQQKTFTSTITVRALFDDVNGLLPGSNVWLSGVKVGTVRKIKLGERGRVEVEMDIDEQNRKHIPADARAKIGTDGLIGNKIVIIMGGTAGAAPVAEGSLLQTDKSLDVSAMMTTLQASSANLQSITEDFKKVSKGLAEGEGSVGKLLKDETLVREMESAMAALKRASLQAQTATGNIADYTGKLQSKGSLANDLVTDTTIFSSLRAATAQIETASRKANEMVSGLKDVAEHLKDSVSAVGLLLNDRQTASQLEATIKNLQESTQKLNENMEALQHNFLLRGYFRKKARAEAGGQ